MLASRWPDRARRAREKPTFADIATAAGVGTATVERVLNGRGGVRPATAERVLAAARRLDYPRRLPERHRGLIRIDVFLVRPETSFFRRLSGAFERIAANLDPAIRLHRTFVDETNAGAIADRIANPEVRRAALILAVPDHPLVRAAVATAIEVGTPVIHVVTRAAEAFGDCVTIDNQAAGRTAASLLGRFVGRDRRRGQQAQIIEAGLEMH